ncbi:MAG: tripartite tricarboxylate transporter substrate binding protein [Variovorax sp.]|nr:tripartite tricarboxylate transporter substrate binding protein [Variovorax sp.]
MVLGYTPGGAADGVARDLGPLMEKVLGQPVVVDYRPGAGGAIAVEAVANAAPDGLTIGLIDGAPLTIVPNARKVNYDPVTSLSYFGVVSRSPLVILANPDFPAKTLPELLALARAKPGEISYATSGVATIHQMSAELLGASTKTSMLHVPYKGAAPALTDLMAGAVKISFSTIAPAVPLVQTGRVRAIAVTADREVAALPGVKTVAAQGVPGYDAEGWFVMAGPKGLPAPIVAKLNQALNAALSNPAIKQKMAEQGNDVSPSTPAAATELVRVDYRKWGEVIRSQRLSFD